MASCGPPPAPEVVLPAPPKPKAPEKPAEDRCDAISKRVIQFAAGLQGETAAGTPGLVKGDARTRYLHEWAPWCARALVEKTRAECAGSAIDTAPGLADALQDHDERRKAARFVVSDDGRLIVEWAGVHHVVRVWEALPDKLRLAWLLSPAEDCKPQGGSRITCHVRFERRLGGDDRQYLLVLDTATNTVQRFDDVEGWQLQGKDVVLASSRRIRRVDWATLAVSADVPRPKHDYASPFTPQLLAGGRSALLGSVLVSLESGAVLSDKVADTGYLAPLAISADRGQLLACSDGALARVDTKTGGVEPISGKHKCDIGPGYEKSGRFAVGIDETVGGQHRDGTTDRTLTPFVIDVATGTARTFASATLRVARRGQFSSVLFPKGEEGRVCASYMQDAGKGILMYGDDHEGDVCPWKLDEKGTLSKKPAPVDPLSAKALKLKGTEVGRATSPDGTLLLIATAIFRPRPDSDPAWELHIAEVSPETRKVLRETTVVREGLGLGWADPPALYNTGAFESGMGFVTPTRAVLTTAPPQVFDLGTGALTEVDGEHLGARWVVSREHDALIDLTTLKRFSLDPDEASWREVRTYGAQCPDRVEDTPERPRK